MNFIIKYEIYDLWICVIFTHSAKNKSNENFSAFKQISILPVSNSSDQTVEY